MSQQENQKVALITGANRGIGHETARVLAQKGVHVIIASRNLQKGEDAAKKLRDKNLAVDCVKLDVTNHDEHHAVFNFLQEKFGRLDILINNAGIMLDDPNIDTSKTSDEVLRKTFETNFFAPVALTQVLLPLLKKSQAGRIVNLSSILGSLALNADPGSSIYGGQHFAYDASKSALNAFTIHLSIELNDTNIKVNSAHPGWVRTEMGGEAAPLEPDQGCLTTVSLALLPEDGPTGGFFHMGDRLPW